MEFIGRFFQEAMKTNIREGIAFLARFGSCAVLLYAGFSKLLFMQEFLQGFPLKNHLPHSFIILSAALLISIELCVALDSLSAESFRDSRVFLVCIYAFFFIISLLRQIPLFDEMFFPEGCNCFSSAAQQGDKIFHLIRNFFFFGMALIACAGGAGAQPAKSQNDL